MSQRNNWPMFMVVALALVLTTPVGPNWIVAGVLLVVGIWRAVKVGWR